MKNIIMLAMLFCLCGCGPEDYVTGTVIEKFNHGHVGLRILGNDGKEYNIELITRGNISLYATAIAINKGCIMSFPRRNSYWPAKINGAGIGRVCCEDIIIIKLNNFNIEK